MSDISKCTLIIITSFYFLVAISQKVVAKQNKTNNSTQFQEIENNVFNQISIENLTTLDYDFFSYDVIDHKTLLIKFDITSTILFQHTKILYDAYLYISKVPALNYKINIGPFSGYYEKELHGTIADHFTFCLVLIPNRHYNTKTIFHKYLRSSYKNQQQHILHYCTKTGPDEDRYHHKKKQGSRGDHILLLLQIMMIGIFLVIIQTAHIFKSRKYKEWHLRQIERIRHEVLSEKEYSSLSHDTLEKLQFTTINNEESQKEEIEEQKEEEDDDDSSIVSHRRLPTPIKKHKRSRSPSPSIGPADDNTNDSSIEHILETKPWLQIPQ